MNGTHQIRYCFLSAKNSRLGLRCSIKVTDWPEQDDFFSASSYFSPECSFVYDAQKPDIVFIPYIRRRNLLYGSTYFARKKFKRAVLISLFYENSSPRHFSFLDYLYSSFMPHQTRKTSIITSTLHAQLLVNGRMEYRSFPKTKFCNYIYSNDGAEDTAVRRAFCKLLMRYKQINAPGRSLKNMQVPDLAGHFAKNWARSKLDFIKDYKFTLAFENSSNPGYVTEKILHPLAVGSIPIYWGNPYVARYYNPEAFVNCHDYGSFEEVIERVMEIDNDPELYEKYRSAPLTVPGNYYHNFEEKMRVVWDGIYAEILRRRQEKIGLLHRHVQLNLLFVQMLRHDFRLCWGKAKYMANSAFRRLVGL